jgi:hypothetical protein
MKALYNAALGDLGPDDLVIVRCHCCHHSEVLKPGRFDALPREMGVMSLAPLLRCQACDEKGRVDISVHWAEDAARPRQP